MTSKSDELEVGHASDGKGYTWCGLHVGGAVVTNVPDCPMCKLAAKAYSDGQKSFEAYFSNCLSVEALLPAAPREVPVWFRFSLPNPADGDDENATACRAFLERYEPEVLLKVLYHSERNPTKAENPSMRDLVLWHYDFNDVFEMVQKRERAFAWPIFWAREVLKRFAKAVETDRGEL